MDKWEIIYMLVGIVWFVISVVSQTYILMLLAITFCGMSIRMYDKRKGLF